MIHALRPLSILMFSLSIPLAMSLSSRGFTEPSIAPIRGEVIFTSTAPKREVGGGKAVIQIFKEGQAAFVGRLTLAPDVAVPLHRDPTEEYLLIEQGEGEITIDGQSSMVKVGDFIYMPAGAEVSFKNGQQVLIALQIFAGPNSARKYDKWRAVSTKD